MMRKKPRSVFHPRSEDNPDGYLVPDESQFEFPPAPNRIDRPMGLPGAARWFCSNCLAQADLVFMRGQSPRHATRWICRACGASGSMDATASATLPPRLFLNTASGDWPPGTDTRLGAPLLSRFACPRAPAASLPRREVKRKNR